MDIKAYIESGILEAYVLGSLSELENEIVRANIALYPEIAAEVIALEDSLYNLVHEQSEMPPFLLKEKIWETILTDRSTKQALPKTIPLNKPFFSGIKWRYAALIALLIGSVLMNFVLWKERSDERLQRWALNERMNEMQKKQVDFVAQLEQYGKAKAMMADTGMQTIVLHTTVQGHPMAATVYWRKSKGDTYVAMNALPSPPQGMQYQMWVIQEGKPVSMGMLQNTMANSPSMQKIPMAVTSGEAFAISLEKEGGNPIPTTVYVLGKV